jgi:DNA-binding response OmpR family regulator
MNGRDLAERLRAIAPDLRVLFMSGYTDDIISRHGVLESGLHYLPKPFGPSTLGAKVREVLSGAP